MDRLKREMEQEKHLLAEKKEQERTYLKKMLEENELNKKQAEEERLKEREQDVQAQMEYAKMLDKQANDRQREFDNRERRAQEFMNKLATSVISKQVGRQHNEDQNIAKYEAEKEMRARVDDERRYQREM